MLRPTTRHGEGGGMEGSALAPALTASLAQEIAGDTSDIIGFNVLITDRNGTVIGSGDRNRVGTFHEASVEVVRTMQPATHNAAQARSLRGVRPGITLPIVLGETALGTVGITGSPAQVRRFGLVVKRQTEILLRVAVVVDLVAPPDHGEPADTDQSTARLALLQTLRATFTPIHDVVAAMPSDRFVALHRVTSLRPADGRNDELRTLCRKAVDQLGRRHGLTAAVGIGDVATTVIELHDSYQDASIALRLGARLAARGDPGPKVTSIDDVRIHQLLAAVGHRPRARLAGTLTTDLRAQADWRALRQSLLAWCETGFNLVHAATALHIHRNTLVYRLNKIAPLTGWSVRDHRAALALYLACLADQLDDDG